MRTVTDAPLDTPPRRPEALPMRPAPPPPAAEARVRVERLGEERSPVVVVEVEVTSLKATDASMGRAAPPSVTESSSMAMRAAVVS